MKHLSVLALFAFFLLFSFCKEKNDGSELLDWGTLELHTNSREALPYYGKHTAIFVDSSGTELKLGINGTFGIPIPVNKRGKNEFETYTQVYDEFRLLKSTEIDIWARLIPEFSAAGPAVGEVADVLYVMSFRQNTAEIDTLFSKMVYQGNWPFPVDDNEHYNSITILGREFKDVERRKTPSPSGAEVFYNREFGIVAFRYYGGKLWRFENLY